MDWACCFTSIGIEIIPKCGLAVDFLIFWDAINCASTWFACKFTLTNELFKTAPTTPCGSGSQSLISPLIKLPARPPAFPLRPRARPPVRQSANPPARPLVRNAIKNPKFTKIIKKQNLLRKSTALLWYCQGITRESDAPRLVVTNQI